MKIDLERLITDDFNYMAEVFTEMADKIAELEKSVAPDKKDPVKPDVINPKEKEIQQEAKRLADGYTVPELKKAVASEKEKGNIDYKRRPTTELPLVKLLLEADGYDKELIIKVLGQ